MPSPRKFVGSGLLKKPFQAERQNVRGPGKILVRMNCLQSVHKLVSHLVHFTLYGLVIIIPIQGTFMTWLGGEDVHLLGLIKIPPLIEENFFLYPQALAIHYYSALILTALFSLHIAAALYHRFMIKDKYGVWNRMSFSRNKV